MFLQPSKHPFPIYHYNTLFTNTLISFYTQNTLIPIDNKKKSLINTAYDNKKKSAAMINTTTANFPSLLFSINLPIHLRDRHFSI